MAQDLRAVPRHGIIAPKEAVRMILEQTAARQTKLLSLLRREFGLSAGLVKRLKWQNALFVNDAPAHTDAPVMPGDRVRVVQFGDSVEFCGGCHAKSTGRNRMVKILSESSVAAGIRRIEAITGEKVENMLYTLQDLTNELRTLFNNAPDVKAAILKSIEENATLKKQIEESMKEKAAQAKARIVSQAAIVNGVTLYRSILPMPADLVKDMAFQLRNGAEDALVIIGSLHEGKPMLTAAASDNMVKAHGMNVGKIVREAAKLIQGGGGGQPHFATAGGKNADGLSAAVDKFVELAAL